jgi:hypothetical protein
MKLGDPDIAPACAGGGFDTGSKQKGHEYARSEKGEISIFAEFHRSGCQRGQGRSFC